MKKHSIHTTLRNILCAVLAFLVVLALPTGWLYDLWAGTGTGQGQWPSEDVRQLQCQEDVETFFLRKIPATVSGGELVPCPLARLRMWGRKELTPTTTAAQSGRCMFQNISQQTTLSQFGNMRSSGSWPAVSITDTI